MIDQAKKQAMIAHIRRREQTDDREILLAPEFYFDGYEHPHCTICANVGAFPTSQFEGRLREVGRRPEVFGVFVRFYSYADAVEFEDSWIGSDSIYVVTSADPEDVRGWFSDFEPSDVWEVGDLERFPDVYPLPDGARLVAVWWD
jgi:hypothetical protein